MLKWGVGRSLAPALAKPAPPFRAPLAAAPSWPPPEHSEPAEHAPPGRLLWKSGTASAAGADPRSGAAKANQDAAVSLDAWRRAKPGVPAASFYGVFDGHGPRGGAVSARAARRVPPAVAAATRRGASAADAADAAFAAVDEEARAGTAASCGVSGSTATVVMVETDAAGAARGVAHVAWVGDSRAVLARCCTPDDDSPLQAIDLTRDHKPTLPGERDRLAAAGARVCPLTDHNGEPMGPARVWLSGAWVPGLAMSRALGDGLARRVGVVATPDTLSIPLGPSDKFIILASDGVWEFIGSQEAVDIAAGEATPAAAARALLAASRARWAAEEDGAVDDVTVVIVQLGAALAE